MSRLMHAPFGAGVGPDRPRRTTAASLRHQSLDGMRVDEEQHLSCARAAHSLEGMRSDMPRLHACHCLPRGGRASSVPLKRLAPGMTPGMTLGMKSGSAFESVTRLY